MTETNSNFISIYLSPASIKIRVFALFSWKILAFFVKCNGIIIPKNDSKTRVKTFIKKHRMIL